MVSKLPMITKMDVNKKPLHHAMLSAFEGTSIDKPVEFSELLLAADMLFMFVFQIYDENTCTVVLEFDVWESLVLRVGREAQHCKLYGIFLSKKANHR